MLFTRLNDSGTAFEPERNLIQKAYGLDGGGTLAADDQGHVYVFWHAPIPGTTGEQNRRVGTQNRPTTARPSTPNAWRSIAQ